MTNNRQTNIVATVIFLNKNISLAMVVPGTTVLTLILGKQPKTAALLVTVTAAPKFASLVQETRRIATKIRATAAKLI